MSSIRLSPRDAIIEAAFDVLGRSPGASLTDIAERAGVGRATLHRHFSSRAELIKSLTLIAIEEMDEAAEKACEGAESHAGALRNMLAALIPLGDRHGFLAREAIENEPEIEAEYQRQIRETHDMVEDAKREGVFHQETPTAWIVQALDHLIYAAWECVRLGETTHAQAADLAWRTLTTGLGARPNDS